MEGPRIAAHAHVPGHEYLRNALLFLGILEDSDVSWLLSCGSRREIAAGQVLIAEGQPVNDVCLILSGVLSVTVAAREGREVARLREGEIVGEMSLVDPLLPLTTVRAAERSRVLSIPRDLLGAKLDTDLAFGRRFYKACAALLASRLRRTTAMLGSGASKDRDAKAEDPDELNPEALDQISIAGARFEWIQKAVGA